MSDNIVKLEKTDPCITCSWNETSGDVCILVALGIKCESLLSEETKEEEEK